MAPDAPAPIYSPSGNIVHPWTVRLSFEPSTGLMTLVWDTRNPVDGSTQHLRLSYPEDEVQEALAHVGRLVHAGHARRLF